MSFRESNALKSPRKMIRANMKKVDEEPSVEIFSKLDTSRRSMSDSNKEGQGWLLTGVLWEKKRI